MRLFRGGDWNSACTNIGACTSAPTNRSLIDRVAECSRGSRPLRKRPHIASPGCSEM
jgi:hypothetical protein